MCGLREMCGLLHNVLEVISLKAPGPGLEVLCKSACKFFLVQHCRVLVFEMHYIGLNCLY